MIYLNCKQTYYFKGFIDFAHNLFSLTFLFGKHWIRARDATNKLELAFVSQT